MNAFDKLPMHSKADLVRRGGEIIVTVTTKEHYISLYLLDNIFVERYFNIESKKVERLSTAEYSEFDKYLGHIFINEIFSLF